MRWSRAAGEFIAARRTPSIDGSTGVCMRSSHRRRLQRLYSSLPRRDAVYASRGLAPAWSRHKRVQLLAGSAEITPQSPAYWNAAAIATAIISGLGRAAQRRHPRTVQLQPRRRLRKLPPRHCCMHCFDVSPWATWLSRGCAFPDGGFAEEAEPLARQASRTTRVEAGGLRRDAS